MRLWSCFAKNMNNDLVLLYRLTYDNVAKVPEPSEEGLQKVLALHHDIFPFKLADGQQAI